MATAVSNANPLQPVTHKLDVMAKKPDTDMNIYGEYNGKDLGELIAAQKAKQAEARAELETVVEFSDQKLETLGEMKKLTLNLSKAVSALQKTNPFAKEQGIFNKLTAESIQGSKTAVTLTMTSNLVPRQVIPMEVKRLASSDTVKSSVGIDQKLNEPGVSKTAALGITGTLVIQGSSIPVTADMNLQNIANSINDASKETNVTASITTVNNQYFMSYSCSKTGVPIVVDNTGLTVDPDTFTGNTNPANPGYWKNIFPPSSVKTASDLSCQVTIRGFDVEYPTNIITDQGEGLNFLINEVGSTVLQVERDYEAMNEGLKTFVESFNELYMYILRPDKEADSKKDADILNDKTIKNIAKEFPYVYGDLTACLNIFGGSFRRSLDTNAISSETQLKNTGLTFNPQKGLEFAGDTWVSNLVNSFDLVVQTFAFTAKSSDRNLSLIGNPSFIPDKVLNKEFTLTKSDFTVSEIVNELPVDVIKQRINVTYTKPISPDDPDAVAVTEDYILDQDPHDPKIFRGQKGTELDGFIFYNNMANDTPATIKFTQGFADRLRQNLTNIVDPLNPDKHTTFKRTEDTINQNKTSQKRRIEEYDKRTDEKNAKDSVYLFKLKASIEAGKQIELMFKNIK